MSIQAINEVRRRVIPGGQKAKHVLLHLADYANADWTCWPSSARISAETQIPERTLARVLSGLKEAGLLSAERRQEGQKRYSDLLTINHDALVALPLAGVDRPEERATVAPAEREHATLAPAKSDAENMPFRADSADHSSYREPPEEPPEEPCPPSVADVTSDLDREFDWFWEAYRYKSKKPDAKRAFIKARKKVSLDTILEALPAYEAHLERTGYDKALAASWLNAERWEDEYPESLGKSPPRRNGQPTLRQTVDVLSQAVGNINGRRSA